MSIKITAISDLFNRSYADDVLQDVTDYQENYQLGALDIIMQRARRNKAVKENKIFDFIQLENDPNFLRSSNNIRQKYEKYISTLSLSTSLVTMVNANIQLAGVSDIIPANLRQLMSNYQSIIDTNINALSNIQQLVSFKQIENAFLSDLRFNFLGETITFSEIALFSDRVFNFFETQDAIKNSGLRPLLALNMQSLLPSSVLDIFETVQWLDNLNTLFQDENTRNAFNTDIQKAIGDSSQRKINTIVVEDKYSDVDLNLNDPLGLVLKQTFTTELNNNYEDILNTEIDNVVKNYSELTSEQVLAIKSIIIVDTYSNIKNALEKSSIGLPKLSTVVKAVNTDTYNKTFIAIQNAIERFTEELIDEIGLKRPTGNQRPLDYLQNIKADIKRRSNIQKYGVTTQELNEIDSKLRSAVIDGKINTDVILALQQKIDNVLKEK